MKSQGNVALMHQEDPVFCCKMYQQRRQYLAFVQTSWCVTREFCCKGDVQVWSKLTSLNYLCSSLIATLPLLQLWPLLLLSQQAVLPFCPECYVRKALYVLTGFEELYFGKRGLWCICDFMEASECNTVDRTLSIKVTGPPMYTH